MNGVQRAWRPATLLACAGLTFGSGVRAEINESELVRVVNESLLRKPAARLTFFSRVRLVDGSSATRVELPFDDLHADIRPRAVAAGWQSNDLVVIIVISEKMLMMCAANGSDGC